MNAVNGHEFHIDFGEPCSQIQVALSATSAVAPKSVVMLIDAFDKDDASVAAGCKGVVHSRVLDGMYAYVPPVDRPGFHMAANFEFPQPASRISVRLVSWPERSPMTGDHLRLGVFYATLWQRDEESAQPRTRVLSVMGGQD